MNNLLELFVERNIDDVAYELINKLKNITEEIKIINENSRFNTTTKFEKFIDENMCFWLIEEAEVYAIMNGGWTKKRHLNYPTTDLPVNLMPRIKTPIFNLVMQNIFPIIAKTFSLNCYLLSIKDIFIVKYDSNEQNFLDFHKDGSLISFNILLNNEFEGGGTIIRHENKESLYESNTGDLFIHCGKILHSGRAITYGKRYLLVGFVEYIDMYK